MAGSGQFYVRFMDDILVLAPTRWKIRKAVKAVNGMPGSPGLEKHPDRTFIGRIERGFEAKQGPVLRQSVEPESQGLASLRRSVYLTRQRNRRFRGIGAVS